MSEYNLERMASHGERRAAEMEESAATLRELGIDPLMVEATVSRQREMGAIGKQDKVRATLDKGRAAIVEADQRGGQGAQINAREFVLRCSILNICSAQSLPSLR